MPSFAMALRCEPCNQPFESLNAYEQHLFTDDAHAQCPTCLKYFWGAVREVHLRKPCKPNHPPRSTATVCNFCPNSKRQFPSPESLMDHKRSKHGICAICHEEFSSENQLIDHIVLQHGFCEACKKIVGSPAALAEHQKTVHGRPPAVPAPVLATPTVVPRDRLNSEKSVAKPVVHLPVKASIQATAKSSTPSKENIVPQSQSSNSRTAQLPVRPPVSGSTGTFRDFYKKEVERVNSIIDSRAPRNGSNAVTNDYATGISATATGENGIPQPQLTSGRSEQLTMPRVPKDLCTKATTMIDSLFGLHAQNNGNTPAMSALQTPVSPRQAVAQNQASSVTKTSKNVSSQLESNQSAQLPVQAIRPPAQSAANVYLIPTTDTKSSVKTSARSNYGSLDELLWTKHHPQATAQKHAETSTKTKENNNFQARSINAKPANVPVQIQVDAPRESEEHTRRVQALSDQLSSLHLHKDSLEEGEIDESAEAAGEDGTRLSNCKIKDKYFDHFAARVEQAKRELYGEREKKKKGMNLAELAAPATHASMVAETTTSTNPGLRSGSRSHTIRNGNNAAQNAVQKPDPFQQTLVQKHTQSDIKTEVSCSSPINGTSTGEYAAQPPVRSSVPCLQTMAQSNGQFTVKTGLASSSHVSVTNNGSKAEQSPVLKDVPLPQANVQRHAQATSKLIATHPTSNLGILPAQTPVRTAGPRAQMYGTPNTMMGGHAASGKQTFPTYCPGCNDRYNSASEMLIHLESYDCQSGYGEKEVHAKASKYNPKRHGYLSSEDGSDFACLACKMGFNHMSALFAHAEAGACGTVLFSGGPLREFLKYLKNTI